MDDSKKAIQNIKQALRQLATNGVPVGNMIEAMKEIEEKYAELEDERIRKWIRKELESKYVVDNIVNNEMADKALAWLEKQGEFKNIDSDDLATLETWEDAIKENKEKWQLSDWFVEATSLLIQKVKRIENNENINIKGSRVMLNACINALRTVGHSHLSDWLEKQGEQPKDVTYTHEVKTGNGNIKALVTEKVQLPEKYEKQGEQKPVEWSEEDKRCLTNAIYACKQMSDEDYDYSQGYIDAINWLKSLRPQSQWKPSDEQINALAKNVEYVNVSCTQPILKGLLEDLKKLK